MTGSTTTAFEARERLRAELVPAVGRYFDAHPDVADHYARLLAGSGGNGAGPDTADAPAEPPAAEPADDRPEWTDLERMQLAIAEAVLRTLERNPELTEQLGAAELEQAMTGGVNQVLAARAAGG